MRKLLVIAVLVWVISVVTSCGDYVKLDSSVIHLSIMSEPANADIYLQIVSATPEVKSSNRLYMGQTPYRGTKTLSIAGLTEDNMSLVTLVITLEKNGYHEKVERYNLAGLRNDLEISSKFILVALR